MVLTTLIRRNKSTSDAKANRYIDPPSILEQTRWPCGFFSFPYHHKVQYFNPSIVDWRGTRYLVARRRRTQFNPGKNDIVFWMLDTNLKPLAERRVCFPIQHVHQHWEDPRVTSVNGALWLSYATFRAPWRPNFVHQGAGWLNGLLQMVAPWSVAYGQNGNHETTNAGNEKNWVWFFPDNTPHFVYSTSPHQVVSAMDARTGPVYDAPSFTWSYGLPRGGTSPVLRNNLYWSFFHSSIELSPKPPRRQYYMGAYAFQAKPPFKPILVTRAPLLAGSRHDHRESSAPLCVFPCGAILDGATWLVTLGVNDIACAWVKIPHAELRALCRYIR